MSSLQKAFSKWSTFLSIYLPSLPLPAFPLLFSLVTKTHQHSPFLVALFCLPPPPSPSNLVFDSCLTMGRKPAHLRPPTVKYSDSILQHTRWKNSPEILAQCSFCCPFQLNFFKANSGLFSDVISCFTPTEEIQHILSLKHLRKSSRAKWRHIIRLWEGNWHADVNIPCRVYMVVTLDLTGLISLEEKN